MKGDIVTILLIFLFAVGLFFASNHGLRGYLRSPETLGKEIKSPVDSLEQYRHAGEAPFKYRPVFPMVVKTTYHLLTDANNPRLFYLTYKSWSAVFYGTSAVALFILLSTLGFSRAYSLAGTGIFLLFPAMLLAFSLPVHTREDTLAYTLFFGALASLARGRVWWFLVFAVLGALTRETLLLLPLLYFFFASDKNLIRKLFISGLPCAAWLLIRVLSTHEPYDPWLGLKWNLANPEQVVGFLYLTFNVSWITFLIYLFYFRQTIDTSKPPLQFYYRSALFTVVVILTTTFIGGIYNEIRLLYLAFPWFVVILLDFIRNNEPVFQSYLKRSGYWIYAGITLAVCAGLAYAVVVNRDKLITPGKWAVPYDLWIVVTLIYVFAMMVFLPPAIKVLLLRKSKK